MIKINIASSSYSELEYEINSLWNALNSREKELSDANKEIDELEKELDILYSTIKKFLESKNISIDEFDQTYTY